MTNEQASEWKPGDKCKPVHKQNVEDNIATVLHLGGRDGKPTACIQWDNGGLTVLALSDLRPLAPAAPVDELAELRSLRDWVYEQARGGCHLRVGTASDPDALVASAPGCEYQFHPATPPAPAREPLDEEAVEMAVAAFDPIPCTWLCGTLAAHDGQLKHTHLNQDGRKALMDLIMARFGVAQPEPVDREKLVGALECFKSDVGMCYWKTSEGEYYLLDGDDVQSLADALLPLLAGGDAYKHLYAAVQEQYRELTVACNDALEVKEASDRG